MGTHWPTDDVKYHGARWQHMGNEWRQRKVVSQRGHQHRLRGHGERDRGRARTLWHPRSLMKKEAQDDWSLHSRTGCWKFESPSLITDD